MWKVNSEIMFFGFNLTDGSSGYRILESDYFLSELSRQCSIFIPPKADNESGLCWYNACFFVDDMYFSLLEPIRFSLYPGISEIYIFHQSRISFSINLAQSSMYPSMWRFNCSTQKMSCLFFFFPPNDFISFLFVFSFWSCRWMDVEPLDLPFTFLQSLFISSASVCLPYILDCIFVISSSSLCPYSGHPLTFCFCLDIA